MNIMIFRKEATELTVHVGAAVGEEVPINMKLVREVVSGEWDNTGARTLICRNRVFGQWRWAIIFGDEAVDPWTWGTWTGGGVIPLRRRGVEGIALDGERS